MEFIASGIRQAIDLLLNCDNETFVIILTTLRLSTGSLLASLALGLPMGFALGYWSFPGRRLVRTGVDTLLSLPTVFIGLLVYALISRRGPLGDFGMLFSLPGIGIGQTILALPIVVALTATAVEGTDSRLRLTLVSLGAGRWQLLVLTLWEVRHGVLAAALTAYGRVMTEVGISMMVGGNIKWSTRTITTAIALETGKGQFAMGIALGLVLLAIALLFTVLLSLIRRRA